MSIPTRVTKENFRLLDLSTSEEASEDLQLDIQPTRKKKISRRDRNRISSIKTPDSGIGASELRCAIQWTFRLAIVIWLVALTWLSIALYEQVTSTRVELNKVSTSSDSVGDALQICHTAAKELRANATDLSARLAELERAHKELEKKVDDAAGQLAAVTEQLAAAPKLVDTPRKLSELQWTVAKIGSQINGFDSALSSARKQAVTATTGLDELKVSLLELEARTNETIANSTIISQKDDELRQQISNINSTLVARIDTLQANFESSKTTSSSTTSTTTTTTVAPTAAASSPSSVNNTAPPAKPSVTE